MTFKFLISASFAACCMALPISACTAGQSSAANESKSSSGDYVKTAKPGAAIEFSYGSNDPATDANPRDVKVTITDGYGSGLLTVKVIHNEALSIAGGAATYTFDMSGSQPHEITVNVKPLSNGEHYLNFVAIAEFGEGQVARANYAVPIYAGVEPTKRRIQAVSDAPEKNSNPGLIVMEAEEEIITETPE